MTLLHNVFQVDDIFAAGTSGTTIGESGLNQITSRVNFGGFDFPQQSNISFTSGASNEILTATVTGETHSYVQTMIYNTELNPVSVKVSGTTIGSTVEWVFYYASAGSLATGSAGLVAGSVFVT